MERRAGLRVAADLDARVQFDGHPVDCRVIELSCTGARLWRSTVDDLPMVCAIEVELDEEQPLRLLARTVWHEGALAGIRFIAGGDADRLEIAERIDELSR
jgi:hypothetical protein